MAREFPLAAAWGVFFVFKLGRIVDLPATAAWEPGAVSPLLPPGGFLGYLFLLGLVRV